MEHMDWDMFSPEDHEFLRFLETNVLPSRYVPVQKARRVVWRVYGDKINQKTGVHRRYYKCMGCIQARRVVISKDGCVLENKTYEPHITNCPLQRKTEG